MTSFIPLYQLILAFFVLASPQLCEILFTRVGKVEGDAGVMLVASAGQQR